MLKSFRLERYFGIEAQFWLNLQSEYDLWIIKRKIRSDIEQRILPVNNLFIFNVYHGVPTISVRICVLFETLPNIG